MSLSRDQIEQFKSEGYTTHDAFFDKSEIAAMRAELERLKTIGKLRNVATAGDGATAATDKANLQLCPMAPHSSLFRSLPFQPKVTEAVSELIGEPIILHLDQVFLKPGGHGMGTNWHQDNAYFKVRDPMGGTAMWIAVHDATLANGTIQVIPGSYRERYEHTRDPYSDHHIRCYPPEEQAVPLALPAGGVAFFCYGTAHCTGANTTNHERAGVAYHFLHTDYANDDLIADDRDYRPYLTGPKATGGEQEYGERVAGTWQAEVEKAITGA